MGGRSGVRGGLIPGAGLLLIGVLAACSETRGWVLAERDAGSDGGCDACGPRVVIAGETPTARSGSSGGGSEHIDLCPDDQLLVGYHGSVGDISANGDAITVTTSLLALCGSPRVSNDGAIVIEPADSLPLRGSQGELASWSQLCPAGQAIIGLQGRAGVAVDRMAFVCASLIADPGDGGSALSIASTTALDPAGGDGGDAFEVACPSGEVARGHGLRAGRWIDAFGLVCGVPEIVVGE